ncbi:MAG: hypothetical protein HY275_05220 [Gemmatimonadetes bacterium]|nr:hypothetical protein [Gemmatimonadota bacterium]
MNPISYDTIAPNIDQVNVTDAQVEVRWKCPSTGRIIGTSTATMAADASMAGRVGASVKRSIASEVIYGVARLISGMLGGAIGRVVDNAVNTAAADLNASATSGVDYTEASRRAAIVVAFESVRSCFAWDDTRQQFVGSTSAPA